MNYVYAGNNRYDFTLKLYMRCNSGRLFNNPNIVSVFSKASGQRLEDRSIILTEPYTISLTEPDACISNPPEVCYEVGTYYFTLILPPTASGYIVSSEVNFRIGGISNLQPGSSQVGATYTAEIPGTSALENANRNNSARFVGSDLVIVCGNNYFNYSFAATDPDNDDLRYSFCYAYQASNVGGQASPALPPPYESVPYGNGFSGNSPLGPTVSIDPETGMVSGIAPGDGIYVVTVCVQEFRSGVLIATQRKDLQIHIAFCNIAAATLEPSYSVCRDSYNLQASNLSDDPRISNYSWTVFNLQGTTIFSSTSQTLNFTFPDTGRYGIKLVISTGQGCTDSTVSLAYVYPGFRPAIGAQGFCFPRMTQFQDLTSSQYGSTNSWSWDFGQEGIVSDRSILPNPGYEYPNTGMKNVILKVTNTKGCFDTVSRVINIFDKPPLQFAFRDTLICKNDRVQLIANGTGNYTWSPGTNIINSNSNNPTCFPLVTSYYVAELNSDGCINKDSVLIRVVDFVTLNLMPDTTICSTDQIRLRGTSDGFIFNWTPASQVDNSSVLSPLATTASSTRYFVTAKLGGCEATRSVMVNTVPYPTSNAGEDTTICFATSAFLKGQSDGVRYQWDPAIRISNPNVLDPVVSPRITTSYILYTYDDKGCPKPGKDTMKVTVLPRIRAFAGNDTSIVTGQILQLHGSGGVAYTWSPSAGLSATNIASPTASFETGSEGNRYKLVVANEAGCKDSAFVNIKIFTTGPKVFVPSAFTPNGDGLNDIIRPLAAGMARIEYFHIYNRLGQLLYSTSRAEEGWNGKIAGKPQDPATFTWIVKAVDHLGRPYIDKGSFILIR